ncbi:MAG: type II toxin-antitoxin system RelE/ParE family toxin [Candidatus Acidiferrales bacterium]
MKKKREPRLPLHSAELTPSKLSFELRFTTDAAADIQGLDGSVRKQSRRSIRDANGALRKVLEKKLAVDPEGYGLPLRGALSNYWKHEFGNHRIIYQIYLELRVVAVCAVGVRKQGDAEDIYRKLAAVAETGRLAEQIAAVIKKLLP